MLKIYHFTFKSRSRSRLFYAAHLHFCKSSPVSVRVQSLTVKYLSLEKWGSLHRSTAVSSLVSVKLVHSSCALREILGSPFVAGDDEVSRMKDLHMPKKNPERFSVW